MAEVYEDCLENVEQCCKCSHVSFSQKFLPCSHSLCYECFEMLRQDVPGSRTTMFCPVCNTEQQWATGDVGGLSSGCSPRLGEVLNEDNIIGQLEELTMKVRRIFADMEEPNQLGVIDWPKQTGRNIQREANERPTSKGRTEELRKLQRVIRGKIGKLNEVSQNFGDDHEPPDACSGEYFKYPLLLQKQNNLQRARNQQWKLPVTTITSRPAGFNTTILARRKREIVALLVLVAFSCIVGIIAHLNNKDNSNNELASSYVQLAKEYCHHRLNNSLEDTLKLEKQLRRRDEQFNSCNQKLNSCSGQLNITRQQLNSCNNEREQNKRYTEQRMATTSKPPNPPAAEGCFPGNAVVRTEDGRRLPVSQLEVGDRVLTLDVATRLTPYDDVIAFLHRSETGNGNDTFVQIEVEGGDTVMLTPNHLIYAAANENTAADSTKFDYVRPQFGSQIRPGSYLFYAGRPSNRSGSAAVDMRRVTQVTTRRIQSGLYAPLTSSGNVVIDDVVVSCYAVVRSQEIAHASMAPVRILYSLMRYLGIQLPYDWMIYTDSGIHRYAQFLYGMSKLFY